MSPFYSAGDDRLQIAGDDEFELAVDVPDGTDVSHLALALHSDVPVIDGEPSGAFWRLLTGDYDEETHRFTTRVAVLPTQEATFALVSNPLIFNAREFDAPEAGAPLQIRQKVVQQVVTQGFAFFIECRGWGASCPPNAASTMAAWLHEIRLSLSAQGFPNPKLKKHFDEVYVETFNGSIVDAYVQVQVGWDAVLDASGEGACVGAAGYWDPVSLQIHLCVPVSAISLNLDHYDTLVHEMFHATQGGYPKIFADIIAGSDEAFLIEGTAEAAEQSLSNPAMTRSDDVAIRPIDITLRSTEASREYEAQDFWVYVGRVNLQGLPYLQRVFAEGGNIDALKDSIPGDTLSSYMFRWARNQAVEKDIDFEGKLGEPCVPSLERLAKLNANELPRVKTNSDAIVFDATLPRLAATMFMVDVLDVYPNNMHFFVPGADEERVRFKVYEMDLAADGSLSAPYCGGGIPSDEVTYEDTLVKGLQNKRYVVLVANVDVQGPQRIVVVVEDPFKQVAN